MGEITTTPFTGLQTGGIIVLPWLQGMQIGSGYDSLTQVVKGEAYGDGTDTTLVSATKDSQTFSQDILRIENTEKLNNSLSVSASVEGSYGLFSASASSTFQTETEVNSYSLYFLINTIVRNSEEHIKNYVLDPITLSLAGDDFRDRFGDYFVEGVMSGGTFYVLMQLTTNSQETKTDITAGLEAGYGAESFSIKGKFSTEIKNASSHKGVNFSSHVGGAGATADFYSQQYDTVDAVLDAASKFPASVAAGGAPMFAILKPYALLKTPPASGTSIDIGPIKAIRQTLTQIYLQAKQVLDSVNYAMNNPSQFDAKQLQGLDIVRQNMMDRMNAVIGANDQLKRDPKAKIELPPMPDLSLIPQRLWGGTLTVIAPPSGVVPSNLRYKIGMAKSSAWALDDGDLKTNCLKYLEQVEKDVTSNLNNAANFIDTLTSIIEALDNAIPSKDAKQVVARLADMQGNSAFELATSIDKEIAQYATFSGKSTNPQLAFLELNLNPVLWSTTDAQYGGVKFWEDLKTTTDALTTIAGNWQENADGAQYYSFKAGLWDLLNQEFKLAQKTLYNPN